MDAYQGIDVMAGMSLAEVKRRYGDKLCLVGNVDPRVIEFGAPEDVEREVDRCLREGGGRASCSPPRPTFPRARTPATSST